MDPFLIIAVGTVLLFITLIWAGYATFRRRDPDFEKAVKDTEHARKVAEVAAGRRTFRGVLVGLALFVLGVAAVWFYLGSPTSIRETKIAVGAALSEIAATIVSVFPKPR